MSPPSWTDHRSRWGRHWFNRRLAAPERNELQSRETDDHAEAVRLAEELSSRGFAVWLYRHEHHHPEAGPLPGPYRVIGEWRAGRNAR